MTSTVTSTAITIAEVEAGWLLDSRATPTIEVTITLTDGSRHRAMAPAGASTGLNSDRSTASAGVGGRHR